MDELVIAVVLFWPVFSLLYSAPSSGRIRGSRLVSTSLLLLSLLFLVSFGYSQPCLPLITSRMGTHHKIEINDGRISSEANKGAGGVVRKSHYRLSLPQAWKRKTSLNNRTSLCG